MGYAFYIGMLVLALIMIPFSVPASSGAAAGSKLFAGSVFPALFPFFVCSRFLLGGRPAKKLLYGKGAFRYAILFFASAVFGTPSAALICGELCRSGVCGRRKASVLCALFSLANPGFVISALSCGLAGDERFSKIYLVSHYAPALSAAIILTAWEIFGGKKKKPTFRKEAPSEREQGTGLIGAISEAVAAILRVGGTIVFFKAVYSVLEAAGIFRGMPPVVCGLLSGAIEFTGGLQIAAAEGGRLCTAASAFILSFGGACLFVQSKLFFEELSAREYFIAKLCTGAASAFAAWALYPALAGDIAVLGGLSESLEAPPALDLKTLAVLLCCGVSAVFSLIVTIL